MLSEIEFRWKLRRLFKNQDAVREKHHVKLSKARKENA